MVSMQVCSVDTFLFFSLFVFFFLVSRDFLMFFFWVLFFFDAAPTPPRSLSKQLYAITC